MGRVTPKKKKQQNKRSKNIVQQGNIRTIYELKFESYLKLLDIPYFVDCVFCFKCYNFYYFGNNDYIPKSCMVCREKFYDPIEKIAYFARPDFIFDFNSDDDRLHYRYDTQHHRMNSIDTYKESYFKKIGIVRIDGGVHDKHNVKVKDYRHYQWLCDRNIKLFVVKNDLIDELLTARKDNGKAMLELCHMIGNAVIDQEKYTDYCNNDKDFQESTRKPS